MNLLIRKVLTLRNFLKVHGRNLRQQMISGKKLFPIFFNEFTEYVPVLANFYMKEKWIRVDC